jgi:ribose/xylose/arabinose/galactoside ABC-type transport system permease subunit
MNGNINWKYLLAKNGTLIALALLILVFALRTSRFFSLANTQTILVAVAVLGVVALPLALLVITGSIDLSVGSVASLTGVVAGKVMVDTGSAALGIITGLGVGAAAGAINGVLVSYLGLNPIVVTLGALSLWGGLALYISDGNTITGIPKSFTDLGSINLGGFNAQILVLVAVMLLAWFVLHRAGLGRRIYAVGGNERAAFLMGVKVRRVRFLMFLAVGIAAGTAGLMYTAQLGAATPITGQGLELNALTVVLLGGIAFAGGAGRVLGVVYGLLFVGVLQNGLVLVGASQFLQQVFLGLVLIAAVALDDGLRQVMRRSWNDVRTGAKRAPDAPGASAGTDPAPDHADTAVASSKGPA